MWESVQNDRLQFSTSLSYCNSIYNYYNQVEMTRKSCRKEVARPLHTPRSGARKPLWHYSS